MAEINKNLFFTSTLTWHASTSTSIWTSWFCVCDSCAFLTPNSFSGCCFVTFLLVLHCRFLNFSYSWFFFWVLFCYFFQLYSIAGSCAFLTCDSSFGCSFVIFFNGFTLLIPAFLVLLILFLGVVSLHFFKVLHCWFLRFSYSCFFLSLLFCYFFSVSVFTRYLGSYFTAEIKASSSAGVSYRYFQITASLPRGFYGEI